MKQNLRNLKSAEIELEFLISNLKKINQFKTFCSNYTASLLTF